MCLNLMYSRLRRSCKVLLDEDATQQNGSKALFEELTKVPQARRAAQVSWPAIWRTGVGIAALVTCVSGVAAGALGGFITNSDGTVEAQWHTAHVFFVPFVIWVVCLGLFTFTDSPRHRDDLRSTTQGWASARFVCLSSCAVAFIVLACLQPVSVGSWATLGVGAVAVTGALLVARDERLAPWSRAVALHLVSVGVMSSVLSVGWQWLTGDTAGFNIVGVCAVYSLLAGSVCGNITKYDRRPFVAGFGFGAILAVVSCLAVLLSQTV